MDGQFLALLGSQGLGGTRTDKEGCAKTAERVGLRHMSVSSMKLGQFLPPVWGKQTLLVKPNLEPICLDLNRALFSRGGAQSRLSRAVKAPRPPTRRPGTHEPEVVPSRFRAPQFPVVFRGAKPIPDRHLDTAARRGLAGVSLDPLRLLVGRGRVLRADSHLVPDPASGSVGGSLEPTPALAPHPEPGDGAGLPAGGARPERRHRRLANPAPEPLPGFGERF